MLYHKLTITIFVITFSLMSQSDMNSGLKPWELLGITSKEYQIARENDISDKKIKDIVCIGYSVIDYVEEPWVELNTTEPKWMKFKRQGMTDEDITKELNKKSVFVQLWEHVFKSDSLNSKNIK